MDLTSEIDCFFERYPSAIGRDLKVTLRRVLTGGALSPEAAAPVLVGLAAAVRDTAIAELGDRWMRALGFPDDQILEAVESAALYAMINTWGVLNSYAGLILANATAGIPFAIILLRSFMLRLDTEVIEASTLDGLGPVGSLWRIVVPLRPSSS